MLGKLDLALKDCNEAVRRNPNLARAFNNRGFVHLRADRLDTAIADFDAALRLNPRQAVPLYCRGIALKRKGLVANGDADIADAKAIRASIVEEMASVGLR
jgi:tetratricopeptide (TPR) repeat protein